MDTANKNWTSFYTWKLQWKGNPVASWKDLYPTGCLHVRRRTFLRDPEKSGFRAAGCLLFPPHSLWLLLVRDIHSLLSCLSAPTHCKYGQWDSYWRSCALLWENDCLCDSNTASQIFSIGFTLSRVTQEWEIEALVYSSSSTLTKLWIHSYSHNPQKFPSTFPSWACFSNILQSFFNFQLKKPELFLWSPQWMPWKRCWAGVISQFLDTVNPHGGLLHAWAL